MAHRVQSNNGPDPFTYTSKLYVKAASPQVCLQQLDGPRLGNICKLYFSLCPEALKWIIEGNIFIIMVSFLGSKENTFEDGKWYSLSQSKVS